MCKQFNHSAMLAALLFGLSVSGTALAFPEVDVGSRLVAGATVGAQTQASEPDDAIVADEGNSTTTDEGTQPTSN
jgi:hypothetical protein